MIFSLLVFSLHPKRRGKRKVTSTEAVIDCEETALEGVDGLYRGKYIKKVRRYSFSAMRGIHFQVLLQVTLLQLRRADKVVGCLETSCITGSRM